MRWVPCEKLPNWALLAGVSRLRVWGTKCLWARFTRRRTTSGIQGMPASCSRVLGMQGKEEFCVLVGAVLAESTSLLAPSHIFRLKRTPLLPPDVNAVTVTLFSRWQAALQQHST